MCRRIIFGLIILALVVTARTQREAQAAAVKLDVDTIKRTLKVPEIENKGFIEKVVTLMEEGKIPRSYVTIAFLRARQRTRHKFQYFKYAMIRLAARKGVNLK